MRFLVVLTNVDIGSHYGRPFRRPKQSRPGKETSVEKPVEQPIHLRERVSMTGYRITGFLLFDLLSHGDLPFGFICYVISRGNLSLRCT
jgi:hypothetical protein